MTTKDELRIRLLDSYYEFFLYFWEAVSTDELVDNWHIKYLCDEVQIVAERAILRLPKEYDLLINISPGTSKSTICTVLLPVWMWCVDPTIRIISSSYSKGLSLEHSTLSRDCIRNPLFQDLFGDAFELKKDSDAKGNYKNNHGGQRKVASTDGEVMGSHAHFIIVDDPLALNESNSEPQRKSALIHVNKALHSRKVDKKNTPTLMIMQRLHSEDPSGDWIKKIKKGKNIKHICIPATDDYQISPPELRERYKNGLMDVNRLDQIVLEDAKDKLGDDYYGQYGQAPVKLGGGILKSEWIEVVDEVPDYNPHEVQFYVDSAYTANTSNDPSVIMAFVKIQDIIYIIDIERVWLEFPEFCELLENKVYEVGTPNSFVYVEPKASGKSIVQSMRASTNILIQEDEPPTRSKEERAHAVKGHIKKGRVKIIRAEWNSVFKKEINEFPRGEHDDQVDCLVGATRISFQFYNNSMSTAKSYHD